MAKRKKPTYEQLEERISELKRRIYEHDALYVTRLKNAHNDISKAGSALMASACIVSITGLGGREIVLPFGINDGLSEETINAIKKDIQRTLNDKKTAFGWSS